MASITDGCHVYAPGLVACSICVPAQYSRQQVEQAADALHPTGLDHGWKVTADEFASGAPNPSPCTQVDGSTDPAKAHWTLTC